MYLHLCTPRPAGTTIKHDVLPLFLPVSIFYLTTTKKYRLMRIKYNTLYLTYMDLFFFQPAGKGQIRANGESTIYDVCVCVFCAHGYILYNAGTGAGGRETRRKRMHISS